MLKKILSVAGFTLLSRLTGFVRDIMLAGLLGAGLLADLFVLAMKLPNHFRAIFAEGAFNAAYVPAYSAIRERSGPQAAHRFASRIHTLLLGAQLVLLALALLAMPWIIAALFPKFANVPGKIELAALLTRITFPYLLFVTLVTLYAGTLNSVGRFAAGAFAPVLLNLTMIAALLVAFLFPSAAHAAAWGVCAAGVLEMLLLAVAAKRAGVLPGFARPVQDDDMSGFWRAFWPGVIGSSGVQLAMLADTVIAGLLPQGALSSVYYADRIYQLPVGVIAIAAGTVLLPEMSRLLAAGDETAAHRAQSRAMAFTVALCAPAFAAFLVMPDLIMRALFARGAFTSADASASALVLQAYGCGLPAIVLIRSAVASFHARGDTRTPMLIALGAIACNVVLKIVLAPRLGAPGLALATAAGAWINLALLIAFAHRRKQMALTESFHAMLAIASISAALMAWLMLLGLPKLMMQGLLPAHFHDEIAFALLGSAGLAIYALGVIGGARLTGTPLRRL